MHVFCAIERDPRVSYKEIETSIEGSRGSMSLARRSSDSREPDTIVITVLFFCFILFADEYYKK